MFKFLIAGTALFISLTVSAQSSLKADIKALEAFMNKHIPAGHVSVTGYTINIEGCLLAKETLVDGGDNHTVLYQLKDAEFTSERHTLNREEAKMYGFKTYWDVNIDDQWILSEMPVQKDVQELIGLLETIQSECISGE